MYCLPSSGLYVQNAGHIVRKQKVSEKRLELAVQNFHNLFVSVMETSGMGMKKFVNVASVVD